jgi:hypothetical protein
LAGALSGLAPEVAYTTRYWGLIVLPSDPLIVTEVASDSPAGRTGFLMGDEIREPASFSGLGKAFDKVREGATQTITVRRKGQDLKLAANPGENQVACVWFPNLWNPIAGGLFICIGAILFVTSSVTPPPLWRTVTAGIAGLGMALGFAVAVAGDGVFARFSVFERAYFVPGRHDWLGQQGLIGLGAAILLTVLAAAEIRQRLKKRG